MEDLRIVRGNDFYLKVPVSRIVFRDNEKSEEPVPLSYCALLGVNLIGDIVEEPIRLPFTVHETYEPETSVTEETLKQSEVIVKVEGCKLECGWYGVEILGQYDGRCFRSYERKVFKIVENNGKSFVGDGEQYGNEPSYQIDTMFTLYAQEGYPLFALDTETMQLYQYGVVENGQMLLDDNGRLIMEVEETFSASSNNVSDLQPATPIIEDETETEQQETE